VDWLGERAGHWLFTKSVLAALLAATDASPTREKARVVTVSSSASYRANGIDFEAIKDGPKRREYDAWNLYYKSKLVGVYYVIRLMFVADFVGL
jgi:retinol dehydrogenase-12